MTPEIIQARTGIDVSTVEQGDEAWAKLRLGVITASDAHNVISKPRSGTKWTDMKMSYFHTLLAEVCTGVAPEVNAKALAWGKQYEEDARTLFEFTTDVKVTESPILFRDESMRTACSPAGHHYAVGSINQSWEAAMRRAGIRYRRAYQSRHTYACWSLAAGANPNFIAKQMGHTDAQMVYRVYGSWMAENNQDQVLILNQKLSEFAPSMPHAVGSDDY